MDPAVGLAVHRLGPERPGDQEDALPGSELRLDGGRARRDDLHLDRGVLLRANALALRTVVVRARLPVQRREDGVPLAELDLPQRLQLAELPPDKAVKVRVRVRRDEAPAPVDADTHLVEVLHPQRREVVDPVLRVREVRKLRLRNVVRHEDLALEHKALLLRLRLARLELAKVLDVRLLLRLGNRRRLRRVLGGNAVLLKLKLQLVGARLDGHPRAVEAEREQDGLAHETVVPRGKLGLRQRERVAKVQTPVHVRERERHHVMFLRGVDRASLVELCVVPLHLNRLLDRGELVTLGGGLGFILFGHDQVCVC